MTNEVSRTIDAVAFAAADLVTPITVLHAAGRFLLTEMDETDLLRWETTQAVGAIAAAQKSIQEATEKLMFMVTKDAELQAEMVDRSGLTTWERPVGMDEDGEPRVAVVDDSWLDAENDATLCDSVMDGMRCERRVGHEALGFKHSAVENTTVLVWA